MNVPIRFEDLPIRSEALRTKASGKSDSAGQRADPRLSRQEHSRTSERPLTQMPDQTGYRRMYKCIWRTEEFASRVVCWQGAPVTLKLAIRLLHSLFFLRQGKEGN